MKKYIKPISKYMLVAAEALMENTLPKNDDDPVRPGEDDWLGKRNIWDEEEEPAKGIWDE